MAGKRKRKTFMMSLVEYQHDGKPIEDILVDAFRCHGTEREAAQALGITQQTFNQWKYRLGLEDAIHRGGQIYPIKDDSKAGE